MTGSRWSTKVVQVLLILAAVAVVAVRCNSTLVKAATGNMKKSDHGEATKKSWAQVGEVVTEEWAKETIQGGMGLKDAFRCAGDAVDYTAKTAKEAKSEACETANKVSNNVKEKTNVVADEVVNEALHVKDAFVKKPQEAKTEKGYGSFKERSDVAKKKASESLCTAMEKVRGMLSWRHHDAEL
ncbi:uncharacterized protein LOC110706724 [Chenopodium quinoa]|uniref:uncharacterized protein LOC110706724 n=1 Tax=Chenopodium quinoa TaxID=63459 RepID=UPI000B779DA5|nr:uncharacterized protein LOC110706724 [Chenopodium quinoa]